MAHARSNAGWPVAAAFAGLALAVAIAFQPALTNGFVDWDDPTYVQDNPLVQHPTAGSAVRLLTTVVSLNYHPVTMLSLWANAAMSGTSDARPFIATNVLLHVVVTWLVFLFVVRLMSAGATRKAGGTRGEGGGHATRGGGAAREGWWVAAMTAALLFGIHPLHVESVAWVSERKDVLYAGFFMAACIAALRRLDGGGRGWLVGTYVLFLLACLSKAMAVVFPVVLLMLVGWRARERGGSIADRFPTAAWCAFALTALAFGLLALNVQGGGNGFGLLHAPERANAINTGSAFAWSRRIEMAAYGFCMYLVKLVAPFGLVAFYPYPSAAQLEGAGRIPYLAAVLGAVAIALGGVWAERRHRVVTLGIAFYAVTIVLVLQLVPVGQAVMADRYGYLSSVGPLLIAGAAGQALWDRRGVARLASVVALALVAGSCLVRTRDQVRTWHDTGTLWGPVIERYPTAPMPYRARGNWYAKNGRWTEAIRDLERSVGLDPRQAASYEGLGIAYGGAGDTLRATRMFDRAIALDSTRVIARLNRGIALLTVDPSAAVRDFDAALRYGPRDDPQVRSARGYALLLCGRWREALDDLDAVIATGAATDREFYLRAVGRFRLDDRAGAERDLEEALRRRPDFGEARSMLALVRARPKG